MKEIKAIIQPFMLEDVLYALAGLVDLPGVTISEVTGWGRAKGQGAVDPVYVGGHKLARKVKLELVVAETQAPAVIEAIAGAARTGKVGDGKIFASQVDEVMKIRTGKHGESAI